MSTVVDQMSLTQQLEQIVEYWQKKTQEQHTSNQASSEEQNQTISTLRAENEKMVAELQETAKKLEEAQATLAEALEQRKILKTQKQEQKEKIEKLEAHNRKLKEDVKRATEGVAGQVAEI